MNLDISESIENSSNSLGEAMLLGMPCVASRVGGIPALACDEKEALLYPFEDVQRLAACVCDVFANPEKAEAMGRRARARALETHDAARNTQQLLAIYREVSGQ